MRYTKYVQFKTFDCNSAEQFDNEVNTFLKEIGENLIDTQFNSQGMCHIKYMHEEYIPESAKDRYKLKGYSFFKCANCPHFTPPTDGRTRTSYCPITQLRVCGQNAACEEFYEELERGGEVIDECY